ncbi:MAG: hypothetical protein OEY51_12050, partial [Cyclobacteriaceae bacterium]|nr:hypothetical protein [Cyclobacteriaceae bacterium]
VAITATLSFPQKNAGKASDLPVLKGPYLGQKPPGLTPVIFAPGIISSADYHELGGGTFSPDGKEYYFTRDIDNRWTIMVSRLESEGWTFPEPENFSEGFTALEPHITFDNRRIFWASWGWKNTGTYMATRTSEGWSEAEYVGPGMMVSSSRDGQMYVTDTQLKPNQIVNVQIENGRFTQYKKLSGKIEQFQSENSTVHPCISPDGSYIIFDTNGTSLYLSFRNMDNEWGKPIDLTKHGFHPEAGIASISPDGKYLFFGRNGDIYWVDAKIIENLKPVEFK